MTKIIICLLLISSCASKKEDKVEKCWNQERLAKIKDQLITMLRTSGEKIEPKLIENTCRKKKYAIGERVLLIINSPNGDLNARTYREAENPKACMDRALNDIRKLSSPINDKIITLHQQRYAEEWKDVDLSPVGWLNCSADELTFKDSLVTFLHELTHGLRIDERSCLYHAKEQNELCFDMPKSLPLRSYGKLDQFPTKIPEAKQALAMFQEIYLTNSDQPFFMQLDEFNSYILSNYNYHQHLKLDGAKNFTDSKGKRAGILMPLFYKITTHYLTRLRQENPKLYAEVFLHNTLNRQSLKKLFSSARTTYEAWKKDLIASGLPEKDFEKALFEEAKSLEKSLDL